MSELTAQERFECPACGGAAEWSPGQTSARLPFLRHHFADATERGRRTARCENSISPRRSARSRQSDRGWQTAMRSVKCQSCQAISVFRPDRVAQTCDFCGSPALVPYDEIKAPIRPESVLPFKLTDGRGARQSARLVSQPLVRAEPIQEPRVHRYDPRALSPYWTFDAQVAAQWTAEAGYYYYTTEILSRLEWQHADAAGPA